MIEAQDLYLTLISFFMQAVSFGGALGMGFGVILRPFKKFFGK